MKISIVHSFYSGDAPSGENVVVQHQVQRLLDVGHDVQVVSVRTDDLSHRSSYKFETAWNVATAGGVSPVAELRKFAPDVVHIHNLFPNYSTRWLAAWPGPVVSTVHNFRAACANGMLLRNGSPCTLCPDKSPVNAVVHACYRGSRLATIPLAIRNRRGVAGDAVIARSDRIIYPAEHVREQYERMGAPVPKGTVIPHFTLPAGPLPPHFAVPGPEAPWLYIGRLSEEKGILPLLDYWPADKQLVIHGSGTLQDTVMDRCRRNIRYGGLVRHEDIRALIQSSRGVVIPSLWLEIGPLTYAEALSCSRPVIAKSGNGAAFDIEKAGTGGVFETFEGLPQAIRTVEADWPGFSARANVRYAEMYSPQTWTRKMVGCYESVAGQ
ncbi:glycosyltransferase [Arthrobacter sp. RT-1]|uniref:glycosyltransferase family 4 protein n=1 Tax=Arthrobacter sp. RT-1 TaxID=2292263 RepID=UPI000E1F1B84|nr:glycosyltransferase family 4 protein [Arthrobacter sp. RT-1]RDV08110.1 glycosyltransferase [Arthrobacter sp. RT-1]